MVLKISPIESHREREEGFLVYPVYSRRSGGLSIGINLFPGKKKCPFNCSYCAVFPFFNDVVFSVKKMEVDLRAAITSAHEQKIPVKDICFSGSGEPTLSPAFIDAFKIANSVREELAPEADQVIITNGAGLLQPDIFSFLKEAAASPKTDIWLKLDAGTSGWYQKINRPALPFDELTAKIKEFTAHSPVTIQTMLCAVNEEIPPEDEAQAWEALVCEIAQAGNVRKVQLYGKIRPAPEDPLASQLPAFFLEQRAGSLRAAFSLTGISAAVEVY